MQEEKLKAICLNWAKRASTYRRERDALADALVSLLNVEQAAIYGAQCGALNGLDVNYHFEKAREALRATYSVGGLDQ